MSQGKVEFMFYIIVVFAIVAMATVTIFNFQQDSGTLPLYAPSAALTKQFRLGIQQDTFLESAGRIAACQAFQQQFNAKSFPEECIIDNVIAFSPSGKCQLKAFSISEDFLPVFKEKLKKILSDSGFSNLEAQDISITDGFVLEQKFADIHVPGDYSYKISPAASLQLPYALFAETIAHLQAKDECIRSHNPLTDKLLEEFCKLNPTVGYEHKGDLVLVTKEISLACSRQPFSASFAWQLNPEP